MRFSSRPGRAGQYLCAVVLLCGEASLVAGVHHMAVKAPRKLNRRKLDITPLLVTNNCPDNIWPGISTQTGNGPGQTGFKLAPGETKNQTVSEDWQGRVWGRTNCSFNDDGTGSANGGGRACYSGEAPRPNSGEQYRTRADPASGIHDLYCSPELGRGGFNT